MESQHQNVLFSDQTPQWDYSVDSSPDPTFHIADTDDATLENFFSRPIKTRSYSWATGTNLFESFNPWIDFFENPRVINRITNFNLLRCKLKVRMVLNGNGFHYGRAIASYLPLPNLDAFTKDRAFFWQDVVGASQRPHVYLDPTTSQGGTLSLPFVWYENALSIPRQDWREMGKIIIHGMQDLKHANGATDSVTVSVFVWAEEVSLSIPTANEPGALIAQCGEVFSPQVGDEYGTGPISRPAGVIARAAGALSKVPTIGAYARATQLAASAVSSVATMFGYSRPVELAEIKPYKPSYLGNMCNTNVPDTSTKLTLDVKQELTIDPRTMGLGSTDEMTIKSISQRESFLTAFGWNVADPAEKLLWNTEVSPVTWVGLSNPKYEIHMPACCFAAAPFRRWRGTMKYRFQIVASSFHKGRLKVTYDPSYALTNEYNTNYTYVIDLAKERDFTVEVGWGQEKSFLNHRTIHLDNVPYGVNPLTADPVSFANGILSVYVVNDLTVPNSTVNNDVEVNVFVSTGDDFEVAEPDATNIEDLVWFYPQSGEVFTPQAGESGSQPDGDLTKNEDEPMKLEPSITMAPTPPPVDNTLSVYFGDPITSFRQCLKRYNFHTRIFPSVTSSFGTNILTLTTPDFPYYRGYAPDAVHQTNVPTAYNYCKMTLVNYLTPAFTCVRGGLRWKYHQFGARRFVPTPLSVTRCAVPKTAYAQNEESALTLTTSVAARARQAALVVPHSWDGCHVTSVMSNPVLEVELPYYANVRFNPAKQANKTGAVGFNMFHKLQAMMDMSAYFEGGGIDCYSSVGEDFTLAFFTGAPVAWRVTQENEPLALGET